MGRAIRDWGQERTIPIRQQIGEDRPDHARVKPLLKEVLVDFGLNSTFLPQETGEHGPARGDEHQQCHVR
jgi:hypothetical protein